MKWFNEREFVCKCCGGLPPLAKANIEALVKEVLDPVRERLGKAIIVNSGYRCERHNKVVGGTPKSQHLRGEAADIAPAGFKFQDSSTNEAAEPITGFKEALARLKQLIIENGKFDQLIDYGSFLHVSYKSNGGNRRQVLRKRKGGEGYELD